MSKRYDAVVIGAGLGGLSAGAFLAKKGLSVLMVERHNVPGGYATSFVRGRYEFEIALHELSGLDTSGRRGALYSYLDYLGVAQKVEFVRIPEMYRSVFPDLDITLPVGRENYEIKMCETFPNESSGIQRFLNRVDDLNREVTEITRTQNIGNPLTAPARYKNLIRYLTATWADVLNRDVKDIRARGVLSQYWGYFGLPPSYVSFLYFAGALASYMRLGPAFIKGRSQTLSSAFVETFEENGGEIRFNCGIDRIATTGNKVTGVVTEDGELIEADWVVSNADPITTCRNLIGEDKFPSSFLQKMRGSTVAPSSINVYLGIACPPEKLGLNSHENFVNEGYDFDSCLEGLNKIISPYTTLVTCYNTVYNEISPPGTSMVVLTSLSNGEPWINLPPEKYVDTKNQVADAMMKMAETIAPGIRQYVETVEVATPLTNMRYTGALGGSIYGFNNHPHNHSVLRMSQKGPLKGLYFAGAWTQPGGGFEPCMLSGQMAGAMIAKQLKKDRKEA